MNNKGFTFIELMVIIVIIVILAAVAAPKLDQNISVARTKQILMDKGYSSDVMRPDSILEFHKKMWAEDVNDTIIADKIEKMLGDAPKKKQKLLVNKQSLDRANESHKNEMDSIKAVYEKEIDSLKATQNIAFQKKNHEESYKCLTDDLYMVYITDIISGLKTIEEIKSKTGKPKYTIKEELSDGIIIKMEW